MGPDDRICYCYDVSFRKLWNFAVSKRPTRASQMSECLGAGTGCGWCIPTLKRIFEAARQGAEPAELDLTPEEYARARRAYLDAGEARHEF